jgi:hypothetical protein
VIGVGQIDAMRSVQALTGFPQYVALQPMRGTDITKGQRWELLVYPTADIAYEFQVSYTLVPNVLTAQHPYPYGGPVHRETVLESCLAVAESRNDNIRPGEGPHYIAFMQQLQASVSHDRKFRPQTLGMNRNGLGQDYNPRAYQYDSRLVTNSGNYS